MLKMNRRTLLKSGAAGVAASTLASPLIAQSRTVRVGSYGGYFENSFKELNTPTPRFPQIEFVVGLNSDQASFTAECDTVGFFCSDETDALAAYDADYNFLGYLGTELIDGRL